MLDRIAARITASFGTMWCAIAFALLTFVSLPATIATGSIILLVQWITTVFIQLVALPIIMVGQNQASASTEQLIRETHDAVVAKVDLVHTKVGQVHVHLTGQTASKDELAKTVTASIRDAVRRGQPPKNPLHPRHPEG